MSDASRDSNRVPALIGNSSADDRTPIDLWVDPVTHRLLANVTVSTLTGLLPFEWDDLQFSNADGNGNYQTGVVKFETITVATLELSYDGSSKLTRIRRV